jgi:hypothetical protein
MPDKVPPKKLYFNGKFVGEFFSTGDPTVDLCRVNQTMKAKGLHKVGEVNVPRAMVNHAIAFAKTAELIFKTEAVGASPVRLVPFIVNGAFAIEIYLKALALHFGLQPHGHDLLNLFDALTADARDALAANFGSAKVKCEIATLEDYRGALEKIRRAFVDWRYLYEPRSEPLSIEFKPLIFVLEVAHETCRMLLQDGA